MACPDEHHLVEYVAGLLPGPGAAAIDRHVDDCASCRELLASFARGSGDGGPPAEDDDAPPPRLDRYELREIVGTGAMAVVYAATDRVLDREVALKVLRRADPGQAARLRREAQAMSRLAHPNVVPVYDVGEREGRLFLTAELVRGGTVASWLAEPRSWREVVDVFLQAGRGLAAAHAAGIAHRDFKPSNVLLGDDGRVRVADFGLARRDADLEAHDAAAAPADLALTRTGDLVGTPAYMAPEVFAGAPADAASDQFSFCVALHEALYGERPFAATDLAGLVRAATAGDVRPPSRRAVPRALRQLLLTGLAADPRRRHASMTALCDALARQRGRQRRLAVAAAGAALVIAATAAGASVARRAPAVAACRPPSWTGLWDPPRRAAVEAAFAASHAAFAPAATRAVLAGLDRFAATWSTTYAAVCEGATVRHDRSARALDLGMACLDARRDQARALVELLATADAHVVERAPAAVGELQDLTACTDARRLAEHPDPPADPAVRGRLAALTRDLARSAALQTAGNYRDAIALATSLVAPARATGYRPIEAEVLVQVGTLHGLMLDGKQAVPRLLDGLTAAQASGDVATTAQAATQLAYATATFDQHFDEAHRWLQLATGALERLDHPRDLEARLAMVHGAIALAEGDAATAQRQYQRAAELRRQLVGDADPSVAIALSGVGMGYERAGDEATARTYYRQALAILEPALGASHPRVADVLSNLGTAERELGHLDEAITLGQRAIAIREQVFGAASAEVAGALLDLAGTLQEARRFEDAVPVAARARAIFAATSNDADASLALTSEGLAALELGHLDDADARLREALAIQERTLGADHPDLMVVLGGLGALALARHDPHDAAARYARATAVVTKAFGPDTTRLIEPLDGQSEAARALGDSTAAIATATRAVTLAATQPDDAAAAAQTAFVLAQALRAGGQQPARARQLAGDALARYQALGPRWATARDEVARWLAASPSP